jgi:hypothetical protein
MEPGQRPLGLQSTIIDPADRQIEPPCDGTPSLIWLLVAGVVSWAIIVGVVALVIKFWPG